ncbi:aquaporin-4-like [Amyelois transitella]|uniref:aquaporin-4-like n=1 Tax=Amyelois transitella TaxID=680683 RepID=UPI0029908015|nr:aquaporin-4-like [Amyelois transitella]
MTVPPSPRSIIVSVIDSKRTQSESESKSVVTWCRSQWKAIAAEIIATMILLLLGCMTCLPIDGFHILPPLYSPIGFGLIVLSNVQIFGHISGAHMNPFVSVIGVIYGKISAATGIAFIIAQCIGSTLGYGILMYLSPHNLAEKGICLTLPHSTLNDYQALGIEMVLTAVLSLLICALWDPANAAKQESVALKFGFTIIGLSIAGSSLTGCSMNPARSLGPALLTGRWESHWVYWVGPLVGGTLSAVFYKYMWLTNPEIKNLEVQNVELEQKCDEVK